MPFYGILPPTANIWPIITFQPVIVEKWFTPRWKALRSLFTEKYVWLPHIASFLLTSALFQQLWAKNLEMTSCDVTWRHVTQFYQNFRKLFLTIISHSSENFKSFPYPYQKLSLFSCFYDSNGYLNIMTSIAFHKTPLNIFWSVELIQNVQETCKTKF